MLPPDDAASEGTHLDDTEIEMTPVTASASVLATAAATAAADSEDANLAAAIELSLGGAGDSRSLEANTANAANMDNEANDSTNAAAAAAADSEGTEHAAAIALSPGAPDFQDDAGAAAGSAVLAAEIARRGLVRRDTSFSSRHAGVTWDKRSKKWLASVQHGGKKEHLGSFATEEEAKARYDARCHELGITADVGESSDFRGMNWNKTHCKWYAQIKVDAKDKYLGSFEAITRGEVDAALAYDRATRAAGRPDRVNFAPVAGSAAARLPAARTSSSGAAISAHREAAATAPPTAPPTTPPKAAQIADSEDTDLTAAIELSLSAAGDRGAAVAARGPPAAAMAELVPLTLRSSIRSSDS
jgi:hypothetical protein